MTETIRVTVSASDGSAAASFEMPGLSDVERALLREYAKPPERRQAVCGHNAVLADSGLRAKWLLGWNTPTPLGRAVLAHYEGGG